MQKKSYLILSALILVSCVPGLSLAAKPDRVKDLTKVQAFSESIEIKWDKIESAERYQVRIAVQTAPDTFTLVRKEKSNFRRKLFLNLTPNMTYAFKIRAYANGKYGEYSKRLKIATTVSPTFSASTAFGAKSGTLTTNNSIGRTGSYYLPYGYNLGPKPVLVLFHGTDGDGAQIRYEFLSLASQYGFIIVAPDSRMSPDGSYIWEVGTATDEVTEDYTHTMNCIAEVENMTGVKFDHEHVLTAGFSAGGSSAPYIAARNQMFTGYAILHGGVFPEGMKKRDIPGWLSTGETDTLRTTDMYNDYYSWLVTYGSTDLTMHFYDEGHETGTEEKEALIAWWLD